MRNGPRYNVINQRVLLCTTNASSGHAALVLIRRSDRENRPKFSRFVDDGGLEFFNVRACVLMLSD
jgi:hypothetical protein